MEASASRQIDAIIQNTPGWRGEMLAQLRSLINETDEGLTEELKWKKPSKPEGVPVWTRDGIVCVAEALKNAVRLTFPKGAQLKDPKHLFNTRLEGNAVRAIDFAEGAGLDRRGLQALVRDAGGRLSEVASRTLTNASPRALQARPTRRWPPPRDLDVDGRSDQGVVPATGLEPVTKRLRVSCSTN